MKKLITILLLAGGLGLVVYQWNYERICCPTKELLQNPQSEMEWLKKEFQLTDTQYQQIKQLHQNYQPICRQMCDKITTTNLKLSQLINSNKTVSPELIQILKETSFINQECKQTMLAHVYAVSQVMDSTQAKRYIDKMKKHIIQPSHPLYQQ